MFTTSPPYPFVQRLYVTHVVGWGYTTLLEHVQYIGHTVHIHLNECPSDLLEITFKPVSLCRSNCALLNNIMHIDLIINLIKQAFLV